MRRECTADNRGSAAAATALLPRLCCSCGGCSGSEHRDGPLSGGWRMRRVRGGECAHKRGNPATIQALPHRTQPLCSSALKKLLVPAGGASLPELHCSHGSARRSSLFFFPHAECRGNGGIRNRRGRAVVRPAGPGAG